MNNSIHWAGLGIDALILFLYFGLIVGIGLYAGRNNKTLRDFALGGRSIPWWAVLASIVAAEVSAATFLGAPGEGFATRSYAYAQLAIGTILARFLVAFLFIAPYYRYRVQSIYEFLNIRFGPWTRNTASFIFLITRVLGMGVRLYLGGVIFVVILRYLWPEVPITWISYFWGILAVTLLTTLYTAIGGIKAVVWTDLIQATLMVGAMIFAFFTLVRDIPGGWATVHQQTEGLKAIGMFHTGWDTTKSFGSAFAHMLEQPYTIFAAILGSTFLTMATHGTDQDMVQRMLTAENSTKSRLSLILSGLVDIPLVLCFLSVGILLWLRYTLLPDPNLPQESNEVFAYYIVNHLPVGIRGLIIAGVFATMMGSTSTALNALATSFIKDFYDPYFRTHDSPQHEVFAARIATVVFGVLMIVVATFTAYVVLQTHITIIQLVLGILGYTYGSLLGVFLLGMVTKSRGADRANFFAMLVGICAVLILCKVHVPAFSIPDLLHGRWIAQSWNFGQMLPAWWPQIASPYYVFVGCLFTLTVALLFRTPSERTRERNNLVEE
ncbi:MAG: sodium:proline symporter [Verrucomicrobia bacterium]|nr:MAG: sodium:proline symporter [Verrucomicrobiota bacterium]